MRLLGIRSAVFAAKPGDRVGETHKGWVQLSDHPILFTPPSEIQGSALTAEIANHLRGLGYPVSLPGVTAFPEAGRVPTQVELGLVVRTLLIEGFDRPEAAYQRAQVECEWQLFDNSQQTVIYSSRTPGVAQEPGFAGPVVSAAILNSLQRVTAQREFAAAIARDSGEPSRTARGEDGQTAIAMLRLVGARLRGIEHQFALKEQRDSFVTIRSDNAVGSGFIITADGYVLTAAHVIGGQAHVDVELASGVTLRASCVRTDVDSDAALIRLPGAGYRPVSIQRQVPGIASHVYAVGTPSGLALTVTDGVLSSVRPDGSVHVLQTSASVSPGSSGGALLDSRGNAIGIVISKVVEADTEGLGFAVGIADALDSLRLEVAMP